MTHFINSLNLGYFLSWDHNNNIWPKIHQHKQLPWSHPNDVTVLFLQVNSASFSVNNDLVLQMGSMTFGLPYQGLKLFIIDEPSNMVTARKVVQHIYWRSVKSSTWLEPSERALPILLRSPSSFNVTVWFFFVSCRDLLNLLDVGDFLGGGASERGSQVDIHTLWKMFLTKGSGTHSWCFCDWEDCCLLHGSVESY